MERVCGVKYTQILMGLGKGGEDTAEMYNHAKLVGDPNKKTEKDERERERPNYSDEEKKGRGGLRRDHNARGGGLRTYEMAGNEENTKA